MSKIASGPFPTKSLAYAHPGYWGDILLNAAAPAKPWEDPNRPAASSVAHNILREVYHNGYEMGAEAMTLPKKVGGTVLAIDSEMLIAYHKPTLDQSMFDAIAPPQMPTEYLPPFHSFMLDLSPALGQGRRRLFYVRHTAVAIMTSAFGHDVDFYRTVVWPHEALFQLMQAEPDFELGAVRQLTYKEPREPGARKNKVAAQLLLRDNSVSILYPKHA